MSQASENEGSLSNQRSSSSQKSQTPRGGRLLTWKDILPWQRDDEFILTGYRRASFSYPCSLWSILAMHNETANVWSHLLGAIWFIASLLYHVIASLTQCSQLQDVLAIALFQLCVSVCFTLSTFYRTFSDHSPALHKFRNELDHLGIVLVMWGTGMSGTHFAVYCHRALRNMYFAFLTLTGLGCAVYTLRPKFRRPEYRTVRFLMYCFLGASLFAPVVHGLLRFGSDLQPMINLTTFLALALINFSVAAVCSQNTGEMVSQDIRPARAKPQLNACLGADRGVGQIERAARHRRGLAAVHRKVWAVRILGISNMISNNESTSIVGEPGQYETTFLKLAAYTSLTNTAASPQHARYN